ncbi:MAG: hypothetical protein FJ293_09630 [Planctomycetes bacterium]|nr:hypothetical protein [Planctomycetota bacterium]
MTPRSESIHGKVSNEEVDAALAEKGPRKRRRRNERNAAAYDDEVCELLKAIDLWRQKSGHSFPAWSEVLALLKGLGWRKVGANGVGGPIEPLPEVAPQP